MSSPFIERETPYPGSFDSPKDTLVSFDIADPGGDLNPSLIDAYIDGADAYHGTTGFVPPYDGPLSSVQFIPGGSFWGYDAYRITIDKTTDYPNITSISASYSDVAESTWTFMTRIPVPYISRINTVYFSDVGGIKKVNMVDFVGESQSIVQVVLSTETDPPIPDNIVDSLYGESVDGYYYLTFSLKNKVLTSFDWGDYSWGEMVWDEDYIDRGCFVVKNEVELNQFSDGYKAFAPKINNRGILYFINKDTNSIYVYYGAHLYSGKDREPDFIYSSTSTPAIFPGEILCLHIANDASTELVNGTRLYIGTSLGLTRIDACDVENPDGYCAGFDNLGKATTYSISGGGATYEIIGGTSPRIAAVSSNESRTVMFVATDDGYGDAGVSQILMTNNKRTTFMTQENGLIPSNTVRDISGKVF